MRASRILLRWGLTLLASLLVMIALILISLRAMPWHLHHVHLAAWRHILPLSARILPEGLDGHADDVTLSLDGAVLHLRVAGLTLEDQSSRREAVALPQGDIGIDLWRLLTGGPAVETLTLDNPHVTLRQRADGRWLLFTAFSAASSSTGSELSWQSVDEVLEQLRGVTTAVRGALVTLEGNERTMTLAMPSLMASHGHNGQWHWAGDVRQPGTASPLLTLALDSCQEHGAPWQLAVTADGQQMGDLLTLLGHHKHYRIGLSGRLDASLRWAHRQPQDMTLGVKVPSFIVLREDVVPRQWQQGALMLNAQLHWDGRRWQGALSNISLCRLDEKGRPGVSQLPMSAALTGDADSLRAQFPAFDITDLSVIWPWLPASSGLRHGLAQLNPQGHVQSLALTLDAAHGITVDAETQQLRLSPWGGIPGLSSVAAHLHTDTRNGVLDATLPAGATLSLPHVFPAGWSLESGRAHLAWQRTRENDWQLDVAPLEVRRNGAQLSGKLSLWAPDRGEGRFSLTLDVQNAVVNRSRDWLPSVALPPALGEWLMDNIHRGRIDRGRIALTMRLEDELEKLERQSDSTNEPPISTQLSFDLSDVTLGYLPGWPALTGLSGHLDYVDRQMNARIDEASLEGLRGDRANAHYANDRLTVQAPITGDASALLRVLKQAPLSHALNYTISEWQAQGPITAALSVDVPFGESKQARVEVNGRVSRAHLAMLPQGVRVNELTGTAHFLLADSATRLTADANGRTFGGPAHAALAFHDADGEVRVTGRANVADVLDELALRGLSPDTKGSASYRARLAFGAMTHLTVDSALEGVDVPLPAPLGKQARETAPLHVDMNLSEGSGQVRIDKRLWARWRHQMTQGQLWLEHWPLVRQRWDDSPGWTIHWTTPRISIDEWLPAIKALDVSTVGHHEASAQGQQGQAAPAVRRLLVDTPCLALSQRCLGQVRLVGNADAERLWRIDATGTLMAGRLTWLPGAKAPFELALNRLTLDGALALAQSERLQGNRELMDEVLAIPRPHVVPVALPKTLDRLPNGQLHIKHLVLNGTAVGDLQACWHTARDTLALDELRVGFLGSVLEMKGRWMSAGSASVTQGRAHLALGNVAKLLAPFGQPEVVRTAEDAGSSVDMAFAWPGAPWQATLGTATGAIDADIHAGRFMSIDSTSVRLVGLLNLNNLLRRLRLDFTDVTRSGTAFNSIKGSGTFSDGILITRRPIDIDAAVTHFTADGQIDLLQRTLNQRIGVTVPLLQGLPVAALLTGLPQLGVFLLGTNWLFGDQLNRLTELHYRVEGPWDAPTFTRESAH